MAQIFHRGMNTLAPVTIVGAAVVVGALLMFILNLDATPYVTNATIPRMQPVQFSHKHHAGDDGIDCRYCHQNVEVAANAGMPATRTCMNCHSQLWINSPYLEPVRESWRTNQPIKWIKVHDLPDFVYFNHSIHVKKGVGCVQCHGQVSRMPLVYNVASLKMEWCIDCHRNPENHLMPKDQLFNTDYQNPPDQVALGNRLKSEYKVKGPEVITMCSTCHR